MITEEREKFIEKIFEMNLLRSTWNAIFQIGEKKNDEQCRKQHAVEGLNSCSCFY